MLEVSSCSSSRRGYKSNDLLQRYVDMMNDELGKSNSDVHVHSIWLDAIENRVDLIDFVVCYVNDDNVSTFCYPTSSKIIDNMDAMNKFFVDTLLKDINANIVHLLPFNSLLRRNTRVHSTIDYDAHTVNVRIRKYANLKKKRKVLKSKSFSFQKSHFIAAFIAEDADFFASIFKFCGLYNVSVPVSMKGKSCELVRPVPFQEAARL